MVGEDPANVSCPSCFGYFLMEERLAPGLPAVFAAARDAGAGSTRALGGTAGCPDLPAALALARKVSVRHHDVA
jgi:hypothetical protein